MRLKKAVADLVHRERVCRVATTGKAGMPHVVPVCQVAADGKVYFGSGHDARKVLNLAENPRLALVVDVYSDAWSHLKGVMIQGRARLIERGPEFRRIRTLLYAKYPQYPEEAALDDADSVIVEVTPTSVLEWGLS
jgi:nitroimidazol reductase NimA-like FMN-containing flavoprotein (pyridoxamine 5'-phosphate oxidase superfamily)